MIETVGKDGSAGNAVKVVVKDAKWWEELQWWRDLETTIRKCSRVVG